MLPWLFGVLFLLNAALFYWGNARERSYEPVPPELPQAPYRIQLLSEVDSSVLLGADRATESRSGVGLSSESEQTAGDTAEYEMEKDEVSPHDEVGPASRAVLPESVVSESEAVEQSDN